MSIIEKLSGLKTARELREAADEIVREIEAGQTRLTTLNADVSRAAFETSAEEARALQAKLLECREELALLNRLLLEANARLETAMLAEQRQETAAAMIGAAADCETLMDKWAEYDRNVAALAGTVEAIVKLTTSLRLANRAAAQAGCGDLRLVFPDGSVSLGALDYLLKNLKKASPSPAARASAGPASIAGVGTSKFAAAAS